MGRKVPRGGTRLKLLGTVFTNTTRVAPQGIGVPGGPYHPGSYGLESIPPSFRRPRVVPVSLTQTNPAGTVNRRDEPTHNHPTLPRPFSSVLHFYFFCVSDGNPPSLIWSSSRVHGSSLRSRGRCHGSRGVLGRPSHPSTRPPPLSVRELHTSTLHSTCPGTSTLSLPRKEPHPPQKPSVLPSGACFPQVRLSDRTLSRVSALPRHGETSRGSPPPVTECLHGNRNGTVVVEGTRTLEGGRGTEGQRTRGRGRVTETPMTPLVLQRWWNQSQPPRGPVHGRS